MDRIVKDESYYIKALKKGSYEAFDIVYDMYSSRLYGYCYQYTKSHEDTQDIVQEVFAALWRYRESIRDENTILYFLFQIAKNRLINRFRSQVNSPVFEEYVSYCDELKHSVNDTSRLVEFDDFKQKIKHIKSKLPSMQRKIYEYSREQELSNKEIAGLMELSEQTVKNQLSLALKVFREKLADYKYISLLIALFYH